MYVTEHGQTVCIEERPHGFEVSRPGTTTVIVVDTDLDAVSVAQVWLKGEYSMQNGCDGSGPHTDGEVRVLPMTRTDRAHGNLILCRDCHRRELAFRRRRNRQLSKAAQFELPEWETLEIYNP